MHLKKIEIKGFKSFPDRTEILFPKGLISVVGPNGSGKSNILDAIRWVLGEQSMKSLRGDKLEDVIFSGTEKRKGMTHCEVSLLMDNADRSLDIDYLEVEIKRRAFQSGESQFFINGRQCRLKDIKELLLDTGIGREGYSIISQGKIDELVNGSSLHRRRVIEEAAGITKYRYRKEESQKKLDHTRENLERICDVYQEIERQVRPLEQQKKKAETYLALREALRFSDVNRLLRERETIKESRQRIEEKLDLIEAKKRELSQERNRVSGQEAKIRGDLQALLERIDRIEADRRSISEAIAGLERESAVLRERKEHGGRNLEKLAQLQIRAEKEISGLKEQQEEKRKEQEALSRRCRAVEQVYLEKRSAYEQEAERLRELEQKIESGRADIVGWMNEQAGLKSRAELLRTAAVQREQNIAAAEEELRRSRESAEEMEIRLREFSENIEKIRQTLHQTEESLEKKKGSIFESGERLSRLQAELRRTEDEEKDRLTRKNLLLKMEEEMEGINKGAKELIRRSGLPGIIDVVASALRVLPGYEKAVEAALGGSLQHLIIKEAQQTKACIAYLKDKKLGRVTFLPLDTVSGSRMDYSDIGILAAEAVRYEPALQPVMDYLLGRIVIVDTMDEAMALSRKYRHRFRIATKEGELFSAGGSITGGTLFHSSSILQRRRSIEDCSEDLQKLGRRIKELQERTGAEEERQKREERERERLLEEKESLSRNLQEEEARASRCRIEQDYRRETKERLERQSKALLKQKEEESGSLLEYERQIEEYQERLFRLKKETEERIAEKESKSLTARAEEEEIRLCEIEKTKLDQQMLALQSESQTLERALRKSGEEKQGYAEEERDSRFLLQELEQSLRETLDKLQQAKERRKEAEEEQSRCQKERRPMQKSLEDLEECLKKTDQESAELEARKVRIEAEESRYDYQLQMISERILEEYQLEMEEAQALRSEEADVSKKHIEALRGKIAEIGNVNLDAIEEFEKVNERYLLYKEQKIDLEQSVSKIDGLIRTLEKNMVSEFAKSFREINEKFGEVFRILFGGGRGELILIDESNWLESAIEINVQPPGKKLKSISVLSGGEKALSAIAILFAILMRKPAPFCILDEIDAPLDDVNIHRFVSLLTELTSDTQFLTITHRRGTMESSDYIYGVTMQENGISKIVSLQLEEATDYIEQ